MNSQSFREKPCTLFLPGLIEKLNWDENTVIVPIETIANFINEPHKNRFAVIET